MPPIIFYGRGDYENIAIKFWLENYQIKLNQINEIIKITPKEVSIKTENTTQQNVVFKPTEQAIPATLTQNNKNSFKIF